MEYALIGLLALAVVAMLRTTYLLSRSFDRFVDAHERFIKNTIDERRELLNRFQFPERMPTKPHAVRPPGQNLSAKTQRAFQQVGKVEPQVSDGD